MSELCVGNCIGCPNVVTSIERDESLKSAAEDIERQALDEKLDTEIAPALFEQIGVSGMFTGDVENIDQIESPEDIARSVRKTAAFYLNAIAKQREATAAAVAVVTEGCSGPLKMRAKKAGRIVTVTVCNSPKAPEGLARDTVDVCRSWDS